MHFGTVSISQQRVSTCVAVYRMFERLNRHCVIHIDEACIVAKQIDMNEALNGW